MTSYERAFTVPADHPSLPGHFPGNPIVPGVLLLDEVLSTAESWLGRSIRVRGVPQVKFVQPLRPAESARISLALESATLKFTVQKDSTLIAQGQMQLAESA